MKCLNIFLLIAGALAGVTLINAYPTSAEYGDEMTYDHYGYINGLGDVMEREEEVDEDEDAVEYAEDEENEEMHGDYNTDDEDSYRKKKKNTNNDRDTDDSDADSMDQNKEKKKNIDDDGDEESDENRDTNDKNKKNDNNRLYDLDEAGVTKQELQRAKNKGPDSNKICKTLPKICPKLYKPVCACTKCGACKTFVNDCERKKYNCKNPLCPYLFVKNGPCGKKTVKCPKCSTVKSTICGKNKNGVTRTFNNLCELKRCNCLNPDKPAFKTISKGACPKPCKQCSTKTSSVCGKNKKGKCQTFKNLCMLERYNCLHKNDKGFTPFKLVARNACGKNCGRKVPDDHYEDDTDTAYEFKDY